MTIIFKNLAGKFRKRVFYEKKGIKAFLNGHNGHYGHTIRAKIDEIFFQSYIDQFGLEKNIDGFFDHYRTNSPFGLSQEFLNKHDLSGKKMRKSTLIGTYIKKINWRFEEKNEEARKSENNY